MDLLNLSDVIFGESVHTPDMDSRCAHRPARPRATDGRESLTSLEFDACKEILGGSSVDPEVIALGTSSKIVSVSTKYHDPWTLADSGRRVF